MLRVHLTPGFGRRRLADIDTDAAAALVRDLRSQGRSECRLGLLPLRMRVTRPNVYVKTGAVTATATASAGASVAMAAYLLLDWLEIAIRHEDAARRCRKEHDPTYERQEAMIAVTASAHAIEGLAKDLEARVEAGELERHRKAERQNDRPGRAGQINAVLVLSLGVDPARWRSRLIGLFKTLRDDAVHPQAVSRPPVPHPDPSREVHVVAESALYSTEGARESVDLVSEIAAAVSGSDAFSAQAVAASIRPRVEQLLAERKRLAALGKPGGK